VAGAQAEAHRLRHGYVGTEHLLLGLLIDGGGVATALGSAGVTHGEVDRRVRALVGAGEEVAPGQLPFTPRAKKVLTLALRDALSFDEPAIGAEHVMLALLREPDGLASRVLREMEVDAAALRERLEALIDSPRRRVGVRRGVAPEEAVPVGGVRVVPSAEVHNLLVSAGSLALGAGRTEIEVVDVAEALRRRGDSPQPPRPQSS
jgi:ATP-dependent Clp protease ATP-binding subunit ClpC